MTHPLNDLDHGPLPTAEDVARIEAMLEPLRAAYQADLAAMEAAEPVPLEEIPIGLRERILGPQRGSLVTVEVDDLSLIGKVERYDEEENVVEVDFYGW